ncbi:nuclear pore complex protein NUP98A-like [Solanum dulcamara]|uniref:nuclear pore complex protein NUP98A-like n=1 Tax=Solanum dulcamara TaxID=45834 RepID=UPI0024861AEF|nr:nuclear pore complex protein NUP98A-like [Solanum dulcamara]
MHPVNWDDDKDVDGIMPTFHRVNYYTVPPMEELISKEKEEAGFCCHVKDFCGRKTWVIVYMDESKKPPVGLALNKPAEITLLNVRCINKSTGKEYRDMLLKKTVEQDAEFVSYDPVEGKWKFRVSHF